MGRKNMRRGKKLQRLPIHPDHRSSAIYSRTPIILPEISSFGLVQKGAKAKSDIHDHDTYEIHYVRCGSGTLKWKGGTFPIKTGDIYYFLPGQEHGGGQVKSKDPAQIFYLGVRMPKHLVKPIKPPQSGKPLFLHDASVIELRQALETAADALAELADPDGNRREIKTLTPALTAKLMRVVAALLEPVQQIVPKSGTPRERELAAAALSILETCERAPPSLRHIANALGVSAAYLGTALRNATGRTYPEVAAEIRVRNAKRFLKNSDLPVREIAQRVGLSDTRSLSRLFKRLTGKSPGEFRST